MSLVSAVKAMARTNLVMTQLVTEERRLERNTKHVEKLRQNESEVANEEDLTEEDMSLYCEVSHWALEVNDAAQLVKVWKGELAVSRPPFFSEEEVADLKEEGVLAAVLDNLERADAAKIPFMLEKNGADFIQKAKWAIKDRYFWNGLCPW